MKMSSPDEGEEGGGEHSANGGGGVERTASGGCDHVVNSDTEKDLVYHLLDYISGGEDTEDDQTRSRLRPKECAVNNHLDDVNVEDHPPEDDLEVTLASRRASDCLSVHSSSSPYHTLRRKVTRKVSKVCDEFIHELGDKLEDHQKHIQNAQSFAFDLVDAETLHTFKEIITERPEIKKGIQWKLWFHIVRKLFSNILFKVIDIGTDLGAAYQHFKRHDMTYGYLTLFFVYLPGFVLSCGFCLWGLFAKRQGNPPKRKEITMVRLGRYSAALFLFPFLYPIIEILLELLLVGLLIRRRDHASRKFMGHDLSQFKSLEGFLESGPSFCLQTYIIMMGHKKGTNIDWANINEDDIERLVLLCFSIFTSFLSIVLTSYRVNVPDPDSRRTVKQYPESSRYYKLTLFLFNAFCILYRIIGISYFCVYLRRYTFILIVAAFLFNLILLRCLKAKATISIILGAISIFVPNGYLLYNFAGTIRVDFSERSSKIYFLCSSLVVNCIWLCGLVGVSVKAGLYGFHDIVDHLIRDESTHLNFIIGMNISLFIVFLIATCLSMVHWYCSIATLFQPPESQTAPPASPVSPTSLLTSPAPQPQGPPLLLIQKDDGSVEMVEKCDLQLDEQQQNHDNPYQTQLDCQEAETIIR